MADSATIVALAGVPAAILAAAGPIAREKSRLRTLERLVKVVRSATSPSAEAPAASFSTATDSSLDRLVRFAADELYYRERFPFPLVLLSAGVVLFLLGAAAAVASVPLAYPLLATTGLWAYLLALAVFVVTVATGVVQLVQASRQRRSDAGVKTSSGDNRGRVAVALWLYARVAGRPKVTEKPEPAPELLTTEQQDAAEEERAAGELSAAN
ncbi:hypothetical protein [Amnibacterium endophyticum]|uniref:Phage holin family protein n=1 Tax=Amnibacterium endophyticum TaxID=2109337 RepID=A0ABW4LBL8_9MICO